MVKKLIRKNNNNDNNDYPHNVDLDDYKIFLTGSHRIEEIRRKRDNKKISGNEYDKVKKAYYDNEKHYATNKSGGRRRTRRTRRRCGTRKSRKLN
jgi:hypothetical protein